ncbi:MAG: hypothetical protein A3G02_00935 [Candidatus Yanofskybacteria bacterium RIFCSPLOWO2_12_FULL_44_13b]|uniref:Glycosyltransferase RgtA/B/C/D-like domain-containing protein n=3 Tax=Parcubacteria group TaxID=1794811 RepID=A0A0G0ZT86_9BACT|nr:MAG: hypothetical protein UU85_C0005G0006 [Candidatus Wolfebacteria bacterium GW2011_GWA2_42_10]KKT90065.1 MAG: hypothetical protein UW90_C0007G0006 [Candidatus Yanofskybacteria bacterium GW2011_GWB1_45_11]OGN03566.1 MAG: hypothetical protein A2657_00605 [Candidatus Yanofskybacteria bacterium RIFCSPHIGHO2_01_FULL_44_110b]OGN14112.1 MAG: hypothetical protein A3C01_00755 [Candidatus Yanofskybacteria bacterium RIFCSPHIGHO2_02_FULL_44_36b]OGN19283.1 MAG: hypothetical protein A3F50_03245 [Candida
MWTRFIKILIELNIMKPSRKAQAWSLLGVTVTALIFRFFRVPFSISSEEGLIMAGVLSVIGLYILARRIYGWQIAGIAAFLAAISHWHVQISRSGSEEIWLVLIITFVFYFVWEGLRTNHLTDYIWAGVLTAAGLYNYENFYFIIPVLIIIFLSYWSFLKADFSHSKYDHSRHVLLKGFSVLLLTGIIISLPLLFSIWMNRFEILNTGGASSVFSQPQILYSFYDRFAATFSQFWFSDRPLLPWPIGIFFAIGLIKEVTHLFKRKHGHLSVAHVFMVSSLFILLIPNFISMHAVSTAMVIPFVMMFSARGIWWLINNVSKWQYMTTEGPAAETLHFNARLALAALLIAFTVVEYYWLFGPLI